MKSLMKGWKILMLAAPLLLGFTSCEEDTASCSGDASREFTVSDFARVAVGENFRATIRNGAAISVRARGCADDLADMDVRVFGGELQVRYKMYKKNRGRVELDIAMPVLTGIDFSGAARGDIADFGPYDLMEATVRDAAEVNIKTDALRLVAHVTGAARLKGSGLVTLFDARVEGAAQLDAYAWRARKAGVATGGTARAWVIATEELTARAAGASRIYYRGDPPATDILTEGTARIIRD